MVRASAMSRGDRKVDHYGAAYGHFGDELHARIRAEAFGEDYGPNGWQTADEQDLFIDHLRLDAESTLLDIACGSGGPTLRIARRTGCRVHGVDAHAGAIAEARARGQAEGLAGRSAFEMIDASRPLPFPDAAFDGLICIDAINHLPDRPRVLADWARVLRPGGRLVFTDPVVVTGVLTHEEIAIRASIGFFLFVPSGVDDRLLEEAGFEVVQRLDRTENMARMAERRRLARAAHEADLRRVEGDETYEGQQRFFDTAARLAAERRLSRFAFLALRRS
ncbi:MAG TPA: methyltransferase domain-containing protein [Candidatus Polarisedimenticolia bacterium]|nr:methyltransferase domain-containing protein [Candidatus Polarisedimenticolia bacterium]